MVDDMDNENLTFDDIEVLQSAIRIWKALMGGNSYSRWDRQNKVYEKLENLKKNCSCKCVPKLPYLLTGNICSECKLPRRDSENE